MLALSPAVRTLDAKIVAVSMFKNGYAVVTRQMEVPGPGQYDLQTLPASSLGTLWFAASDGSSLDAVQTVTTTSETKVPFGGIETILDENVGKTVTLGTKQGDAVTGGSIKGKLLSTSGDTVIVETDHGTVVIPKSIVSSINASKGDLKLESQQSTTARGLRFTVSGKAGHLSMLSLEKGITWAPGYAVDVSDKNKLTLIAKSTVINDLADLKSVDARFVTGFPNVEFSGLADPLTSGDSADRFVSMLQSFSPGPVSNGMISNIGGQSAGRVVESYGISRGSPAANMPSSQTPGEQLEDLFFYKQPDLTLNKGDRAYFILFRSEATYKEIYTWETRETFVDNGPNNPILGSDEPDDVWHTLEFKNNSGKPLTTGPATTFQNGQILGQDTMSYVSAGGDAELRITKALDVRAEKSEEEVSRERGAIKNPANYPMFDLVTMKATFQATNMKSEPVSLRIRHDYTGEFVSGEGEPDVKKTAQGLRDVNPTGRVTWNKTLKAGEKLTLTYTYKVYVRSQ